MGEKGQCLYRVLVAGGKDAAEGLLSASTGPGSIAAEDLAVDHRRAHGLLGRPVRGLDVCVVEEGEDLIPVTGEVAPKCPVALVRQPAAQQSIQSFLQSPPGLGQLLEQVILALGRFVPWIALAPLPRRTLGWLRLQDQAPGEGHAVVGEGASGTHPTRLASPYPQHGDNIHFKPDGKGRSTTCPTRPKELPRVDLA